MPDPVSPPAAPGRTFSALELMTQLQQVTAALADTQTPVEVFRIVLGPVLGAVSSVLLLVGADGQRFDQVESWGVGTAASSLWQTSPLDSDSPATQVLRTGQPLFFEQAGELVLAYPDLGAATGKAAAVSSAVLPMTLNGKPLGTHILDFQEPHHFTAEERQFLLTLATQVSTALGRVRALEGLEQRVQARTAALDAFVQYTEAADGATDLPTLTQKAVGLLEQHFPGCTSGYYVLEDGLWKLKVHSADLDDSPELLSLITAGLAIDTPVFVSAVQSGLPVFVDVWNAEEGHIEHTEVYQSVGTFPLIYGGETRAVFAIGLKDRLTWTSGGQAIVRAVARSLTLALEHAEQARVLQQQNHELEARTRALEAVAALASDLSLDGDVYALIRRAQQVALSLLPVGASTYHELEGSLWRTKAQVGDVGNPALQDALDAGVAFETTLNLKVPWTTGEAHYQDSYVPATDGIGKLLPHVQATATLPLRVGDRTLGIVAVGLFHAWVWSPTDRVVLDTIVRSLGLVIEGAQGVAQLAIRNRELEDERAAQVVFAAFTERVATETDVRVLSQRAFSVMDAYFPEHSSAYYEIQDGLWKALVWTSNLSPEQTAMIRAGVPLSLPSFALALETQEPVFIDDWNPEREQMPNTDVFGPACLYPLLVDGEVLGLFTVGLRVGDRWRDRDQAMMRALGRSLTLALERTEQTRHLTHQRDLLDAQTQLLTTANQDMEAFSYSVSHDLRTPVRHIKGFSDLLIRSLGGRLDPQTKHYLQVVGEAADRMNTMIDAMLDLSRSSMAPLRLGPVDLEALVSVVRSDLEAELLDRRVTWRVAPLPPIMSDWEALRQVLTNLISNALKYTRNQPEPSIEIWAQDHGEHWTVSVRDNGVGFDPAYQHRLFGVFQRLHSGREFEGNGVGLATVKRLILKHGGEVFAHSQPGQGATFGFTLPKRPVG
jgi:signal transduction histidine kinase/putative methionine-R-sulfoxide reductase with GAF domain